jgi:simple sugar transport system substrate-binding protein
MRLRIATRRRGVMGTAATVAAVIFLAAGCTASKSGTSSSASQGSTATGSTASASGGLIIDVNGDLANPIFPAVLQGAKAAAKELGINFQYSAPPNENNFVPDYSALIKEAIARHPAAMVIGDFVPSAFDPLIKEATRKGIPVVIMNTGINSWRADGALAFVGEDPPAAGEAGGTEAVKAGIHHLLCVNGEPANPYLTQRCHGTAKELAADGGTMAELDIPLIDANNPAASTQAIQGFLSSHPDIDGVEALSSSLAVETLDALHNLGRTGVKVGTFDVSTAVLRDIQSGKLYWAVDQQPYLQGFDSLQIAAQYLRYHIVPQSPIITGGRIITGSSAGQMLAVQSKYPGLVGPE